MSIRPTADERARALPGDDIVERADVVMDRAFRVLATPTAVWPWIVQLGKKRAGWYFPRSVERLIPRRRRALRMIDRRWQHLAVGDVIPDYGGADATFEVAMLDATHYVVYRSQRGRIEVSWAIVLEPFGPGTRLHFRLRLGGIKRKWLATSIGDLFDAATIAGLAAGLRERLSGS